MRNRTIVHQVPSTRDLWRSEHERLFYFENVAADAAEERGEDFADLISVDNGQRGQTATVTYRVLA
ncbi:hypothetical protein BH683_014610 [Williamsia sp. 1138]|uniref:hypothetical protein n=1 Tax=Williamsia sp. 1138 TaxID=1903117 RepID=UPI000A11087D|nr:hypothetical protein [Williamsia sp. 1138]OZG28266.1 hypothetical protein BH683_014610 [Williamsia sp. 1138]